MQESAWCLVRALLVRAPMLALPVGKLPNELTTAEGRERERELGLTLAITEKEERAATFALFTFHISAAALTCFFYLENSEVVGDSA